jgi:hypothetical protein
LPSPWWLLTSTAWRAFYGTVPRVEVMGLVGTAALIANGGAALMLYRFRTGDANMRSVWICSCSERARQRGGDALRGLCPTRRHLSNALMGFAVEIDGGANACPQKSKSCLASLRLPAIRRPCAAADALTPAKPMTLSWAIIPRAVPVQPHRVNDAGAQRGQHARRQRLCGEGVM